jgi:hypothetical protein
MAAVGFRLNDRVYGLTAEEAQFLGGQLRRRVVLPDALAQLADEVWEQSMLNPDAGEISTTSFSMRNRCMRWPIR